MNDTHIEEHEPEKETFIEKIKSRLSKFSKYIDHNLWIVKLLILTICICFIMWLWNNTHDFKGVMKGGSNESIANSADKIGMSDKDMKKMAKAEKRDLRRYKFAEMIDKFKNRQPQKVQLLTAGFTLTFKLIYAILMVIGIVLILIAVPIIPVVLFLTVSYFITRRQLWEIRTL